MGSSPSPGGGSSASERSRATPTPSPVSNTVSVEAREPTETVNIEPSGQTNNIPTQPAQPVAPTNTLRLPTSTPTPSPEPTATVAVHTQTGGAVIMQALTSTPTPPPDPTPTPTPVPGSYWERFTQAEYDQFLPPRGAIQWPRQGKCQIVGQIISGRNTYSLNDLHSGRDLVKAPMGP